MKRYAYCPVCGAPSDSAGAPETGSLLHCAACGFDFWKNSKPAVGALVVRTHGGQVQVLLTRRGIEPYKGWWDLPGGFLENGELPEHGLARELDEELGTKPLHPLLFAVDIDEYPREDIAEEARFVLGIYYRCDLPADAVLTPADDVVEARWFPLSALPAEIAFSANKRVLASLARAVPSAGGPSRPG